MFIPSHICSFLYSRNTNLCLLCLWFPDAWMASFEYSWAVKNIFPRICDWHELFGCKHLETISLVVKEALSFLNAHEYVLSSMLWEESVSTGSWTEDPSIQKQWFYQWTKVESLLAVSCCSNNSYEPFLGLQMRERPLNTSVTSNKVLDLRWTHTKMFQGNAYMACIPFQPMCI